jgi:hypothetical protein
MSGSLKLGAAQYGNPADVFQPLLISSFAPLRGGPKAAINKGKSDRQTGL